MIYTVTFNPALDYVLEVKELQSRDINRAESEQLYYGGKGINVSAVLSRLGVENKALGFLAGFSGRQLEDMLGKENIANDFVYLKNGNTRINVKIKSSSETEINAQGPDIGEDDLQRLFEKLSSLKKGDFLVLAGSIPKSVPNDIYEKILEKLKGNGVSFVVDATGDLLLGVLKYKPFLIKPNHRELGEIFGKELNDFDEIIYYAKKLREKGAENVLVSCGKMGAVLVDADLNVHKAGNVPGKIVSSVGCGDSVVAGFVAGYIESKDYDYAFRFACACGNATAFSQKLASKSEIEEMFKNNFLK